MRAPIGTVPGLCTIAATYTVFGIGTIFYFITEATAKITPLIFASLTLMTVAMFFISRIPLLITSPVENENIINPQPARKSLHTGTMLFLIALLLILAEDIRQAAMKTTPDKAGQISEQLKGK